MLSYATTANITGLEPTTVTVEVDLNRGKPQLIIIGLASQSVTESKERITSALLNCGIVPKSKRTIVNLAPADIKKSGTGFDLAIVVAMLKAYKEISYDTKNTMFFGELSLDGSVKKIRGIIPMMLHAKKIGIKTIVIPRDNLAEVSLFEDMNIFSISNINELLKTPYIQDLPKNNKSVAQKTKKITNITRFEDIYGQHEAKKALEIAAAGGHNILLTGPPGTGKSMLAQTLVTILPPLEKKEIIEVNSLYSISGLLDEGFIFERPFRAPHHTISDISIIGGGTRLLPGEISLAHRGVLFMDEIPEFSKNILESLRQPLENGQISITRVSGTIKYPCEFMLVAASNPCPCGYKYSQKKPCICTQNQFLSYKKKLSGPILDRIDLKIFVQAVQTKQITQQNLLANETSKIVKKRVELARNIQMNRYKNEGILTNSQLSTKQVRKYCQLEDSAEVLLKKASQRYGFSTRTYFKIIKVSKTIADLKNKEKIAESDILQALQFRQAEL